MNELNLSELAALKADIEALKPKPLKADLCSRCNRLTVWGDNYSHDKQGRFICGYCVNEQTPELAVDSSRDWAVSRLLGLQNKQIGLAKALNFEFAYELEKKPTPGNIRFGYVNRQDLWRRYSEYKLSMRSRNSGMMVEHYDEMEELDGNPHIKVPKTTCVRVENNPPIREYVSPKERQENREIEKLEQRLKNGVEKARNRRQILQRQIEQAQKALERHGV